MIVVPFDLGGRSIALHGKARDLPSIIAVCFDKIVPNIALVKNSVPENILKIMPQKLA